VGSDCRPGRSGQCGASAPHRNRLPRRATRSNNNGLGCTTEEVFCPAPWRGAASGQDSCPSDRFWRRHEAAFSLSLNPFRLSFRTGERPLSFKRLLKDSDLMYLHWIVFWRVPWNGRGREATDAVRRRAGRGPRAPQRERRGGLSSPGVSPREPDGVGGGTRMKLLS
jgi:hypothetical protein